MLEKTIYFDHTATAKPLKESLRVFEKVSEEEYFNPSALYSPAFNLSQRLNSARKTFLHLLGSDGYGQVIFTSGATEANNIAVLGTPLNKKKKLFFSSGEHPSVYNCALHLKDFGYDVEFIPLQKNGEVDYDFLEKNIDESVQFLSTMHVSNETGAINDLNKIHDIISRQNPNIIWHVDCVQSFGKFEINAKALKIDLCSLSAHKIGGSKGCGALYVKQGLHLKNINYGGGQEFGIRSGTLNPPAILAFEEAAKICYENMHQNFDCTQNLREYLFDKLAEILSMKIVSNKNSSPYITSLLCSKMRGETLMRCLDSRGIIVGMGSACSANKMGNRVLESMGYTKNESASALRISLNHTNTKEEIDFLISSLKEFI